MNLLNWYFKQKVGSQDLNELQTNISDHLKTVITDLFTDGLISGGGVSENSTPDLNVLVDTLEGYGANGERIEVPSQQTVDCSTDVNGNDTSVTTSGNEKWISLYVDFDWDKYDARTDGNGDVIQYKWDEYFKFEIIQGDEATAGSATKPAVRHDGSILLADILLAYGQTQIFDGDINEDRKQNVTNALAEITAKEFTVEDEGTFARLILSSFRESEFTHTIVQGQGARGSKDTPTALQDGDEVLRFLAKAFDGANYQNIGEMTFEVAGPVSEGTPPESVYHLTITDDSGNKITAMTLNKDEARFIKDVATDGRVHVVNPGEDGSEIWLATPRGNVGIIIQEGDGAGGELQRYEIEVHANTKNFVIYDTTNDKEVLNYNPDLANQENALDYRGNTIMHEGNLPVKSFRKLPGESYNNQSKLNELYGEGTGVSYSYTNSYVATGEYSLLVHTTNTSETHGTRISPGGPDNAVDNDENLIGQNCKLEFVFFPLNLGGQTMWFHLSKGQNDGTTNTVNGKIDDTDSNLKFYDGNGSGGGTWQDTGITINDGDEITIIVDIDQDNYLWDVEYSVNGNSGSMTGLGFQNNLDSWTRLTFNWGIPASEKDVMALDHWSLSKPMFLCLGDSVTRGTGYASLQADGSDSYAYQLNKQSDDYIFVRNTNGGSQVGTVHWAYEKIEEYIENFMASKVFLALGLHSVTLASVPVEHYIQQYLATLTKIRTLGAEPIAWLMTRRGDVDLSLQRTWVRTLQDELDKYNIPYVNAWDCVDLSPNDGEFDDQDTQYYESDNVHLNATGHDQLTTKIINDLGL